MKLLIVLLALGLLVWLLRKATAGRVPTRPHGAPLQQMVGCAHCGLHVPTREAVTVDQVGTQRHFCCTAHVQAYLARTPEKPS